MKTIPRNGNNKPPELRLVSKEEFLKLKDKFVTLSEEEMMQIISYMWYSRFTFDQFLPV